MTIQEAIHKAHNCAKAKGFHSPSPPVPAMLALIITELCEAIQADRSLKYYSQKNWTPRALINLADGQDEDFKPIYECFVKDTLQDKLAGACIRIFDLAGALNLNIKKYQLPIKHMDFLSNIMDVITEVALANADPIDKEKLEYRLSCALALISTIADEMQIDLPSHIEAAMKYNRIRKFNHGKKY